MRGGQDMSSRFNSNQTLNQNQNQNRGITTEDPQNEQHRDLTDFKTPSPPRPPSPIIRYRECLKNHAASMGSHVTDGCGEFFPGGDEGLKCAACDCHRNFHRREVEGEAYSVATSSFYHHPYSTTTLVNNRNIIQPPPPLPPRHQRQNRAPVMMAFGGEECNEDVNLVRTNDIAVADQSSSGKKRFRTKFTKEQKERMQEFAERLGWKIQKQNESDVSEFCNEVGVKRQVFKVWIHNCKQALKRKQS